MDQRIVLRPVTEADLPFLAEMALLAAFPPGPLPEGAHEMPHATRWTEYWGRPGDAGVVAWEGSERIGAAWCRIQSDMLALDAAGRPLPEVATAVPASHRSRGVGAALLEALAVASSEAGHEALALTVNARNPALHLYARAGFEEIRREGERLTMTKHLGSTSP